MQQRRRCDIRYYVMLVIGSHLSPTTCTLTIKFFFFTVMFYKKYIGHKYKHLVGDKYETRKMIRAPWSAARRPLSCFSPIASLEQKNKINPCTVPLFHHHQLLPQRKTFHDRPGWICGKSENGKLEEPGWGKNSNIHCFFLTSSFL